MKYFKRENWQAHTVFIAILSIYCSITIILLFNLFLSSFKTSSEFFMAPWALPKSFSLANYQRLFIRDGFMRYYRNSFIVMICSVAGVLSLACPAAYGLGRFNFRGNSVLRFYFLIGMMVPGQLAIIPLFHLVKGLGLMDKIGGLIVIYTSGVALSIFILTKFTLTIPESLRESAKIDGASEFVIFLKIFLPLMKPGIGSLIPLTAIGYWNDFFVPLIFITSNNNRTVPIGLTKYFTATGGFDMYYIGVVFAAMSVAVFPLVIIYLFGSKNIMSGIMLGSVKQ